PPIVDRWGPRGALVAIALFSLAAALTAAATFVEGPERDELEDEADALRHPLRDRRIWRLSLGSSLLLFTQIAVTGFVVYFLSQHRHFSHAGAGAVLAAMNVVAAAGRLAGGRLSDRIGSRLGLMRAVALATAVTVGAVA